MTRSASAGPYHVGIAVPDLDAAMAEFSTAVGLRWGVVRDEEWERRPFRLVLSLDGPMHIELIQGPPGSPWNADGGSFVHHLGFWTPNIAQDKETLAARGLPIAVDGCPHGRPFSYHATEHIGTMIELVDVVRRPGFVAAYES